ncbi:hypothetical protein N9E48_03660 [Paracoccaceae bacterium]|nr:hypothetical protein [Paracoccaceae bacterium]
MHKKNGFEFKDKELERSADRLKEEVSESGWIEVVFSSFNFRLRLEALGKFIYCLKKHEL